MPTVGLTPLRKPADKAAVMVMAPTAKARPAGSSAEEVAVVVSPEQMEQQLLEYCQIMDSTGPDESFQSVFTGM